MIIPIRISWSISLKLNFINHLILNGMEFYSVALQHEFVTQVRWKQSQPLHFLHKSTITSGIFFKHSVYYTEIIDNLTKDTTTFSFFFFKGIVWS